MPDDQKSATLPLNDQEAAKLALTESGKKVSDLKARQWEITKNAVVILAFLAAAFHGDLKYVVLPLGDCAKYAVLIFYFSYFSSIFWQASSNANRYKTIYRTAAMQLFSAVAQSAYYKDKPENMIEDEGRLEWFLFLVVFAFFVLVLVQICANSNAPPALLR
jgi:hypothetical protein